MTPADFYPLVWRTQWLAMWDAIGIMIEAMHPECFERTAYYGGRVQAFKPTTADEGDGRQVQALRRR